MIGYIVRWRDEDESMREGKLLQFVSDRFFIYGVVLSGEGFEAVKIENLQYRGVDKSSYEN
jgi:hypothetical protein